MTPSSRSGHIAASRRELDRRVRELLAGLEKFVLAKRVRPPHVLGNDLPDRPIILMDEPTSGLEPETDARISVVLATSLKDKTVLTIAHRKESLGRYDRVVEMSAGRILKARESTAD